MNLGFCFLTTLVVLLEGVNGSQRSNLSLRQSVGQSFGQSQKSQESQTESFSTAISDEIEDEGFESTKLEQEDFLKKNKNLWIKIGLATGVSLVAVGSGIVAFKHFATKKSQALAKNAEKIIDNTRIPEQPKVIAAPVAKLSGQGIVEATTATVTNDSNSATVASLPTAPADKTAATTPAAASGTATPNATAKTPNATAETPNATAETPNATEETPNATEETPNATEETPQARDKNSLVNKLLKRKFSLSEKIGIGIASAGVAVAFSIGIFNSIYGVYPAQFLSNVAGTFLNTASGINAVRESTSVQAAS